MTENNQQNSRTKTILNLLKILFLGAIGSGIWDIVMKPAGSRIIDIIFVTFADTFSSYRNSLFKAAALGFHEQSSVFLHSMYIATIPAIYLILVLEHPYRKKNKSENETGKVKSFIRSKKGFQLISIITVAVFLNSFLDFIKISYVNRTITHFHQTLTIIEPFISSQDAKIYRAAFSAMKSSEDYKRIDEQIKLKAKQLKITLPEAKSVIY
ncbi:hypothetical protein EHR01_10675 [Leptospira mtsangambouensis]|uniref:Uncharacterized protein n=1 Tax=Leptospira mtsangambouensis TaxID=2484912 RepID=A0ABY2NZ36_9LEPT|nr:hypothetical protein [Leptospira mtsangambouensis]TGM74382.1 hypothetical protein EHR01_10675 [Leptospira mtsangambouensis]